ncbi:CHAP domain-containing protein [Mycobacterium sp. DL99]|uniref:CHAP domain-containing protein n=1 Tax=Mycobacterium sp. DL99 TaxID=2528957 RepID=UPI001080C9CB|nr:CHAP domain-containing protein [Mycobacterium sp. DL99]
MHKRAWLIAMAVAVLTVAAVGATVGYRGYREHVAQPEFPQVDTSSLSPGRAAVMRIVAQEYATQPGMFKYSEGNDEPWCADFTSWVMRESGEPFANPNSGHWRIPGVLTLTDYLHNEGRWEPTDYLPQPGDMVIYDEPSPKHQHVNIVVADDNGTLTTIGGGEGRDGGLGLSTYKIIDDPGIQGFGRYE